MRVHPLIFDLLLAGDGRIDVFGGFVVDQPVDVISFREAASELVLVLVESSDEVVGNPDVESARPVCEDVDAVLGPWWFGERPGSSAAASE